MKKYNNLAVQKVSRNIVGQLRSLNPGENGSCKLPFPVGVFLDCPFILLLRVFGQWTVGQRRNCALQICSGNQTWSFAERQSISEGFARFERVLIVLNLGR